MPECRECSAPDPAGGAHDAPLDSLVGWRGGHPSPRIGALFAASALQRILAHLALAARRLRRLVSSVYPPIFLAIG